MFTIIIWIFFVLFIIKCVVKPLYKFTQCVSDNKELGDAKTTPSPIPNIYNIDQLPSVKWTKKYTNIFLDDKECSTNGLYTGSEDVPADCAKICGSSNFTYKFIDSDSLIINGGFVSKRGGYCLPDTAVHCNTFTSRLIKTFDNWKCLPKSKLFGGKDGCKIIGCNGSIKDNLTGIYYNGQIPQLLAMSNSDTETVSHKHVYDNSNGGGNNNNAALPPIYRFQCTDTEVDATTKLSTLRARKATVVDFMKNKLIPSEFSRFDRIRNACSSQIFNASHLIMPDYANGTCSCFTKLHTDDKINNNDKLVDNQFTINGISMVNIERRCTPCITGWSSTEKYLNVGIECRKAFDASGNGETDTKSLSIQPLPPVMVMPCGVRKFADKSAACMNAKFYVSKGLSHFARKVFDRKS